MRKIITITFVTLDGVMQAPGGSDEDREDGFKYGGWQYEQYDDEISGIAIQEIFTTPFELLLGKTTYEIFSSYWPDHPEIELVATPFNKTKKYVISHEDFKPSWNNTEVISENVIHEIKRLKKEEGPDLHIWGSSKLIQTLLENDLIDRMHVWIYPLTIGTGKKLFANGTQPKRFKMIDSKITTKGVILATYEPSEPLKI